MIEDVYVYDRLTGFIRRVSVTSAGVAGNNSSREPMISADGQSVAFFSAASNFNPNGGFNSHIYVADINAIPGRVNITITPVDDQVLQVATFTPTASGFTVAFNRALVTTGINLYDSQAANLRPADVVLLDSGGNVVRGSMVFGTAQDRITFLRSGSVLPADTYTVRLRSAANGFRDTQGGLLDGDSDGNPGTDYVTSFTVEPSSAVIVSVPDFARGPGQAVNVPATEFGLPLRLSNSEGVTSVTVFLTYNPNVLNITNVTVAPGLPTGAQAFITGGSGGIRIDFSSPELPAGITDFVRLTANVTTAVTGAYTLKQVLDLSNVTVNGQPGVADDGLHVIAFPSDASGNGTISSMDAALAQRVAIGLDNGLDAFQLADPRILIDVNGNGRVDSTDATWILQKVVGLPRPQIPDRPAGVVIPTPVGPDTLLSLPKKLRGQPGDTLTVPVLLDISVGLRSAELALSYDARRLELATNGVRTGTLTGDFDLMIVNSDAAVGTLRIGLSRLAGPIEDRGPGSVVLLTFRIKDDAPAGKALINLRQSLAGTETALNEGALDLNPDPSDRAGDVLDGLVTVLRPRRPAETIRDLVFAAVSQLRSRSSSDVIGAFFQQARGSEDVAGLLLPRKRRSG